MEEIKLNEALDEIMILAPHCDDELLSCGGLIQAALAKDISCKVIFLTNGDSFRWAAIRNFRHPFLSYHKFQEFGRLRQQEAITALEQLGLNNKNIYFLGYPDRGLEFLWSDYWHDEDTYFSRYTGSMINPYDLTYKPARPYTGKNLVEDLIEIISTEQPTKIFVSSPLDDHADHWAAYNFLHYALAKLNLDNKLEDSPAIYQYLTHKGRWPIPTAESIIPPSELDNESISWIYFDLNSKQQTTKLTALKKYKSQLKVTKKYLLSFITNNEIFIADDIRQLKLPTNNRKVGFKTLNYKEPTANIKKLRRRPGGEIKRIKLSLQQSNQLKLKLITKNKYSHHYSFRLELYLLLDYKVKQQRDIIDLTITPAKNDNKQASIEVLPTKADQLSCQQVKLKQENNAIEITIGTPPLKSNGYLFFKVQSYFKTKALASAAWRVVNLTP